METIPTDFLARQSVEDFKEALRAEADEAGMDLDELLDGAGRALPDRLPTEPHEPTDKEIAAFIEWTMAQF